jgi:hypothetical protein
MSDEKPPALAPSVVIVPVEGAKERWWRRSAVQLGAVSILMVLAVGGAVAATAVLAAGPAPTETPEYINLERSYREAQRALADAEAQVTAVEAGIPGREKAVADAEAAVAQREADVASAEADVADREKAVGIVEDEIAANTISGEGVYEVGRDMRPGTYRAADNAGCYWQISTDPNGDDIVSNDNVDGPAIVSVRAGQYFTSSGCGDWVLDRR